MLEKPTAKANPILERVRVMRASLMLEKPTATANPMLEKVKVHHMPVKSPIPHQKDKVMEQVRVIILPRKSRAERTKIFSTVGIFM